MTQTVVARDDPAFNDPTKFVGSVYDEQHAHRLARSNGWTVKADGAGWRRVVASPTPNRVVEIATAELLVAQGITVVLAGGGGVPVVEATDGSGLLTGVEAVVDKDYVAALVAAEIGADLLVMLTDVPAVMTGFGTPSAQPLGAVTDSELAQMSFPAGSMGPKVTAACRFVTETGGRAAIGSLEQAADVISGTAGTQVRPG